MMTDRQLRDLADELQNQINSRIEGLTQEAEESENEHDNWDEESGDIEPDVIDNDDDIAKLQEAGDALDKVIEALT